MYRRSLAALWTGFGIFLILAIADASIDFMGHFQGLWIGGMAMCFVSVWIQAGFHKLHGAAIVNRTKSEHLHDDVDQLRTHVIALGGKVDDVEEWIRTNTLVGKTMQNPTAPAPQPEPNQEPCPVYPLRLGDEHGDIILGRRTSEPVPSDEVYRFLEANETQPGRHSAS